MSVERGKALGLRVVVATGHGNDFVVRYFAAQSGEAGRDDLSRVALEGVLAHLHRTTGRVTGHMLAELTKKYKILPGFIPALWRLTLTLADGSRRVVYFRCGSRETELPLAAAKAVVRHLDNYCRGQVLDLLTEPPAYEGIWLPEDLEAHA